MPLVHKPSYLVSVPSQDKVGVAGRTSGVKMGDDGGGSLISPDGVSPTRMVGVYLCYLPLHQPEQPFYGPFSG